MSDPTIVTGATGTANVLPNLRISEFNWSRVKSKRRNKKPANKRKGR